MEANETPLKYSTLEGAGARVKLFFLIVTRRPGGRSNVARVH